MPRRFPSANGIDGWLSTGATIVWSTIIPSANPPLKHIPTAPTPGPPAEAEIRGKGTQPVDDRRGLLQGPHRELTSDADLGERGHPVGSEIARPGVPTSEGMTTVNPAATTSLAKAATFGVIPGISWITMTPGPVPRR